jgi:phage terminase small subunit
MTRPSSPPSLTPQQEQFCREYLLDYDGKKAAIRAKYSPKAAAQQASRLLTQANIKARITQLKDAASLRARVSVDEVIAELAKFAFLDIKSQFQNINESGTTLKPFEELDGTVFASINEKRGKDGDVWVEVRFPDKMKALELLGNHLGAFDKKRGGDPDPESTQTQLARIADALEARDG